MCGAVEVEVVRVQHEEVVSLVEDSVVRRGNSQEGPSSLGRGVQGGFRFGVGPVRVDADKFDALHMYAVPLALEFQCES